MNTTSHSTNQTSQSLSQVASKGNNRATNHASDTGIVHCTSIDVLARLQDLVEYYFRPLNQSNFMTSKLKEGNGFVSLNVILSFKRVQQLCEEAQVKGTSARALLKRALVGSEFVVLSKDGLSVGPTKIEDKELLRKLRKQVEYYFSPQNLSNDPFLSKHLEDGKGTVPIELLCDFPRIRNIHAEECLGLPPKLNHDDYPTASPAVLRRALQGCKFLNVTDFYYRVGPLPEGKDSNKNNNKMATLSHSSNQTSQSWSQVASKGNNRAIIDACNRGVVHCTSKDDKMLLARLQDLVEFYFRPLNQNNFMTSKLKEGNGFVSLNVILSFNRVQQLCEEAQVKGPSARALLQRALVGSEFVALSRSGLSVGPAKIEDKELLKKLRRQVEYYFSPKHLEKDHFLSKHLEEGKGTVPIELLCNFPRIRKIHAEECLGLPPMRNHHDYPTASPAVLRRALQGCKFLNVTDFDYRVGPGRPKEKTCYHEPRPIQEVTLYDWVVAGL